MLMLAMLALLFHQDYGQGFNLIPMHQPWNNGGSRAVEAPSNHLAYQFGPGPFLPKDFRVFVTQQNERGAQSDGTETHSLSWVSCSPM
jgi:hypothetical protein